MQRTMCFLQQVTCMKEFVFVSLFCWLIYQNSPEEPQPIESDMASKVSLNYAPLSNVQFKCCCISLYYILAMSTTK